jgi:DNA replication protein DnaC
MILGLQIKNQAEQITSLKSDEFAALMSRIVIDDAGAAKYEAIQRRDRRQERRQVLCERLSRRIPPLFRQAHIRRLNAILRRRLMSKPVSQGLLIWGPAGVGKTYTIMALIRWYVLRGVSVKRVTYAELLLNLRSCFNGGGSEKAIMNSLLGASVLFIDDLAAGSLTDYSTTALLNILDTRLEKCKPTIITTNLSPESLSDAFGERLSSRLKTFMTIKLGGQDKRGKEAANG